MKEDENFNTIHFQNQHNEELTIEFNNKKKEINIFGYCRQSFTFTGNNPESPGITIRNFFKRIFTEINSDFSININTNYMDTKFFRMLIEIAKDIHFKDTWLTCNLNISESNKNYTHVFEKVFKDLGIILNANLRIER